MSDNPDMEHSQHKQDQQQDDGANDYSLSSNSVSNASQRQGRKEQSHGRQKKRLSLSKEGVSPKEDNRSVSKSQESARSRSRSAKGSRPPHSRSGSRDRTHQPSKREPKYGSSEERHERRPQDYPDKGDRSHKKSFKRSGNDMDQYDGMDQYQDREPKYQTRYREHGGMNRYEGRGRKSRYEYPPLHKHLFTKKEFENYQSPHLSLEGKGELNDAYDDYVQNYKKEQDREFYQEHKTDPWFVERYCPEEIFKWKQAQYALGQYSANRYREVVIESLKSGSEEYLQIKLDQDPHYDYNNLQNEQGLEISLHKAPLFAFDTDSLTLYLKYIPVEINRLDLKSVLMDNLEGFIHLSMSEPMRNHHFDRLAWVNFSNEHHCEQALEKIRTIPVGNFALAAARSHPNKKRTPVRITPPLPANQVLYDLELCKKLISQVFDPEKQIDTYVIDALEQLSADKPANEQQLGDQKGMKVGLSDEQKLDLCLLYLRRVHAFCLYCGEEYEDERMLSTRCGPQHIRNHQNIAEDEFNEIIKQNANSANVIDTDLISPNKEDGQSDGKNPENEIQPPEEVKKEEINEIEEQENELWTTLQNIGQLDPKSSSNWGGSIIFLKRYVGQALDRIKFGPRKLTDPYQEFLDGDQETFCKYHTIEIEKSERYKCDICGKKFEGEKFVVKHIRNKHIEEAYAKRKTKEWVKETFRENMRRETKSNYYSDKNKLFNQPGRKYHPSETQYYAQGRRGSNEWAESGNQYQGSNSNRGNYPGSRGGSFRDRRQRGGGYNRGDRPGNQRGEYVDYDDPERNSKAAVTKPQGDREVVDYSDLFQ